MVNRIPFHTCKICGGKYDFPKKAKECESKGKINFFIPHGSTFQSYFEDTDVDCFNIPKNKLEFKAVIIGHPAEFKEDGYSGHNPLFWLVEFGIYWQEGKDSVETKQLRFGTLEVFSEENSQCKVEQSKVFLNELPEKLFYKIKKPISNGIQNSDILKVYFQEPLRGKNLYLKPLN